MTEKYGKGLSDDEFSFDPVTGQFVGTNKAAVARANKMNKMNLYFRYVFDFFWGCKN